MFMESDGMNLGVEPSDECVIDERLFVDGNKKDRYQGIIIDPIRTWAFLA